MSPRILPAVLVGGSPFCSKIINYFLMLLCPALPGRAVCLSVCHNELCSWMQPISSPGQRVGKEEGIQRMKSSREMYLTVCDTLCVWTKLC